MEFQTTKPDNFSFMNVITVINVKLADRTMILRITDTDRDAIISE